jgi:hypothetical protein
MNKQDVVALVVGMGYSYSNTEIDRSTYDRYVKIDCPDIWVGNWFMEIETEPVALAYGDCTIDEVNQYLSGDLEEESENTYSK